MDEGKEIPQPPNQERHPKSVIPSGWTIFKHRLEGLRSWVPQKPKEFIPRFVAAAGVMAVPTIAAVVSEAPQNNPAEVLNLENQKIRIGSAFFSTLNENGNVIEKELSEEMVIDVSGQTNGENGSVTPKETKTDEEKKEEVVKLGWGDEVIKKGNLYPRVYGLLNELPADGPRTPEDVSEYLKKLGLTEVTKYGQLAALGRYHNLHKSNLEVIKLGWGNESGSLLAHESLYFYIKNLPEESPRTFAGVSKALKDIGYNGPWTPLDIAKKNYNLYQGEKFKKEVKAAQEKRDAEERRGLPENVILNRELQAHNINIYRTNDVDLKFTKEALKKEPLLAEVWRRAEEWSSDTPTLKVNLVLVNSNYLNSDYKLTGTIPRSLELAYINLIKNQSKDSVLGLTMLTYNYGFEQLRIEPMIFRDQNSLNIAPVPEYFSDVRDKSGKVIAKKNDAKFYTVSIFVAVGNKMRPNSANSYAGLERVLKRVDANSLNYEKYYSQGFTYHPDRNFEEGAATGEVLIHELGHGADIVEGIIKPNLPQLLQGDTEKELLRKRGEFEGRWSFSVGNRSRELSADMKALTRIHDNSERNKTTGDKSDYYLIYRTKDGDYYTNGEDLQRLTA